MTTLVGASSGCANARENGFLVSGFLKTRCLVDKRPQSCWAVLCFAVQQHSQPWDEPVNSSHTSLGQNQRSFWKILLLLLYLFWGCIQPLCYSYFGRDLVLMGEKLMISELGIRWITIESAIKPWVHIKLLGSDTLLCIKSYTWCFTSLPFLVRLIILSKDTPKGLSSSCLLQASKT